MATLSQVKEFERQVRRLPKLLSLEIQVSGEGDEIVIAFSGIGDGKSADYAWRRRRNWMGHARRIARQLKRNVTFDFSRVSDALVELEQAVSNLIRLSFPNLWFELNVEFGKTRNAVVVVNLGEYKPTSNERKALEQSAKGALRALGVHRLERVVIIDGGMREATDPQVLRVLRVHAPCTKDRLREELEREEFQVPSVVWLNRRLDYLRQKALVNYLGDGLFAPSPKALLETPARIGRYSQDVQRALALGKRKAW